LADSACAAVAIACISARIFPVSVFASSVAPTAEPTSSMSLSTPSIDGVETTRTGILTSRSLAIASAAVNPAPPAITRSGLRLTIFSTSTVPKVTTSGNALASAG
jgi:hypothetical protein